MLLTKRKLLLSAAFLAAAPRSVEAFFHGNQFIEKNLVTDFGAPTNGTSDTTPAWLSFNTFLSGLSAGKSVRLTVPNHTYNFIAFVSLSFGILNGITVVIDAPTGAVFHTDTGGTYWVGTIVYIHEDNTHSARIVSVSGGSNTVTLVTLADNTIFHVGQWILITGIDLQGAGFPMNPAFFEFQQITGIDTGTGIITLASTLSQQYLSTWPLYTPGDGSNLDLGGPATIYALDDKWNVDITFNNITFDQPTQSYCIAKKMTFNNCVGTNQGLIPSVSKEITYNNCVQTAVSLIEVDKCIQSLTYNNCAMNQIQFQSMSGGTQTQLNNCTFTILNGTPRNITINGGSISTSVAAGPTGYGRTDTVTINNCAIAGTVVGGSLASDILSNMSMTSGVIAWPIAGNGPAAWAVPGTNMFYSGSVRNQDNMFTLTDLSRSGPSTLIATSAAGTFATTPPQDQTQERLDTHPCPVWNASGNTGGVAIIDLSQSGAQNKPLYSYSKRTYTGANISTAPSFQVWGQIVAININVTQPYTGVQSTLTSHILGGNGGPDVITANRQNVTTLDPVVNLKQIGTRQITSTTVSSQSGDTFAGAPGNIWFAGQFGITSNHDISAEVAGNPSVDFSMIIEIIADQGM